MQAVSPVGLDSFGRPVEKEISASFNIHGILPEPYGECGGSFKSAGAPTAGTAIREFMLRRIRAIPFFTANYAAFMH